MKRYLVVMAALAVVLCGWLALPHDLKAQGACILRSWSDPQQSRCGSIWFKTLKADSLSATAVTGLPVDNSTIELASNVIRLKDAGTTLAKLANLTSANFILGNSSNRPTAVTMSVDATMANTGAVTIATGAVTSTKIADGTIAQVDVSRTFGTGTAPTAGTCGSSPAVVGSDMAGILTVGGGGAVTACTLTFSATFTNTPACTFTGDNTGVVIAATSRSATAYTIGCSADCQSDVISYVCIGQDAN